MRRVKSSSLVAALRAALAAPEPAPDADTPTGIPAFWGVVFAARTAAAGGALTTEGREKALSDINALLAQRHAAPDAALLALVAPMVAALLRDAESAIEAHRGPGQHVGTPKVTVDALRLANVFHAIAAAAKWGAA